ncbi:MAG: hypothetical protein K0Q43_5258 [Ramlibacter sp.]|nr:hypothetical protein [Ramlibacter sp.]
MQSVRRKSNESHSPSPSAKGTDGAERDELASRELTCEKTRPSSGGRLLPLSRFERLPPAMLAYEVGDLLEFDERSDLGQASKTTNAAMALGTSHPLYAKLYAEQVACRKLAAGVELVDRAIKLSAAKDSVKLARDSVDADRASREKAERARAAYAIARKDWACRVQRAFTAKPRDVMQITSGAQLLSELGRTDAAIQLLRWGLKEFPNDRFARLQLAEVLVQARPPADSAVLPDPTDQAITEARTLKNINPKGPRPRVIIARALLLQARDLSRKGDHAGSVSAAAAALGELSDEPAVNDPLTLAMVEHSLGHKVESAAAIKTYLDSRRGREPDAKLAEVYAWRGEPKLAVECLKQVLARNIHDPALCHVAHSRFMDNLRSDPRWLPLLSRMNRAPDQLAAIPLEIQTPPDHDSA